MKYHIFFLVGLFQLELLNFDVVNKTPGARNRFNAHVQILGSLSRFKYNQQMLWLNVQVQCPDLMCMVQLHGLRQHLRELQQLLSLPPPPHHMTI